MVKITFPDGSVRDYEQGVTGYQVAESLSPALARDVVSCEVNGETRELNLLSVRKFPKPMPSKSLRPTGSIIRLNTLKMTSKTAQSPRIHKVISPTFAADRISSAPVPLRLLS